MERLSSGLLNAQDMVVVLDERGKEATSEGLARLLAKVICRAIAFWTL